MQRFKKIVATVGKDRNDKNIYRTLGAMFKRDDGTFCVKIDSLPVGYPEWTGWANLYDFDDEKKPPTGQPERPTNNGPDPDDEIPF